MRFSNLHFFYGKMSLSLKINKWNIYLQWFIKTVIHSVFFLKIDSPTFISVHLFADSKLNDTYE